ncbi:Efflux pump [Venturia nashicola]|uniref:Potassium transport protein n=1 Tax=Venturia nashicola TaxID=86259 RepID=A0A4Z1PD14_9PEZI|nr:Efflux pump [Venturia nashicola]TLD35729.1 Efflux pump [Venturia nashicola]
MLGKFVGKIVARGEMISQALTPPGTPKVTLPPWLKLPNLHSFNFILLHYFYMILMTIIGSILLFPAGGLRYIDALFFAAGAATQSGLNTVDVNTLFLYQQIVLVLMACLCNPIIINTFVVFVRLYWFEKRFRGVARQAREFRRTRTLTKSRSEAKQDLDVENEERGIQGRQIKFADSLDEKTDAAGQEGSAESGRSESTAAERKGVSENATESDDEEDVQTPFHRDIVFADEVARPPRIVSNEERIPEKRSPGHHIAFVENQRNPKDSSTLYIPSPRDVERGYGPQRLADGDSGSEIVRHTSQDGNPDPSNGELNGDDHPFKDVSSKQERFKFGLSRLKNGRKRNDNSDSPQRGFRNRIMSRSRTFASHLSQEKQTSDPLPYLSYAATIGRNSTFVDLTEEQREELGGIEYRALKTLAWVLLVYYFGYFILGYVIFLPWITQSKQYSAIVRGNGASPVWWGFFTSMSMFTDLGFTLTPDSMISFQRAVMPMLVGSFLIIIGNTGFPCMLRFMIWIASKCVPYGSSIWEEFRFLLDHPRRCFTLLFPQKATWWLFGILIFLNGLDLVFFIILDLKDPTVTALPGIYKFLDGLFQAASTRTAGFACVNLADLHPAIQVSYLVMMYISVFPIAISVRQTNVYEEKSLGIYGGTDDDDDLDPNSTSYLGSHLRRQLSFDLWYVFLGLFLIACIEGKRLESNKDVAFNIFSLLFEIVSAYGTVGLSLGYPGINASFSAEFRTLSKLIIIAMMVRGRHRGLPYALDRAILLPSESLQRKEKAMDQLRRTRRESMASLHRPSSGMGLDRHKTAVSSGQDAVLFDNPGFVRDHALLQPPAGIRRGSDQDRPPTAGVDGETPDMGPADNRNKGRTRSRAGLTKLVSGVLSAGPPKSYKAH